MPATGTDLPLARLQLRNNDTISISAKKIFHLGDLGEVRYMKIENIGVVSKKHQKDI